MEAKAKGKRSQAADGQRQRQADDKEAFFGWQHLVAEEKGMGGGSIASL